MENKTKIITAIIPMIILGITIWWYLEYQDRAAYRAFSTQMLKEDCFGVDAQWTVNNELLNDPKVFDCETQKEVDYYWEKLSQGGDEQAQVCYLILRVLLYYSY